MNAGETFYIPLPGTSLDSHLWVVISDPAKDASKVLIINFTTKRPDSDPACILRPGEHPFVQHETCVNYAGAKVVSVNQITGLLQAGKMCSHAPVSSLLLKRILDGAGDSTQMAIDHANILIDQGLLDC